MSAAAGGDITGLDQSIAYAQHLAEQAASHGVDSNEAYLQRLQTAGVTGVGLATAQQMQAAFAGAAATAKLHAVELEKQKSVQEQYDANPDTGDKTYLSLHPDGTPMPHTATNPTEPPAPRPDPLKVAARLVLADGETFAGSGSVKDTDGGLLLAAAADTPTGRQVHLGVAIDPEDRRQWRGAHAAAQENVIDEQDGDEYAVDTGADRTVLLDAIDAARLPDVADDVIRRATAADVEFRQLCKEYDRLAEQRAALERRRFTDPAHAEQMIALDEAERREVQNQRDRRRFMDDCAARLDPADRAAYDALQAQLDAGGGDAWEPGCDEQAAALCGLSVDEYHELQDLKVIKYLARSREQNARVTQLDIDRPPLVEQQAALICGLTIDEFREMLHLQFPGRARRPYEQARLDELDASRRGATASTARDTVRMRGRYLGLQRAHHSSKANLSRIRQQLAALRAAARPLDPAAAAELEQVTTALTAVSERHEQMAGGSTVSVEIVARNGGALVFAAVQQEDGGVRYQLDRKPVDADDDWHPGSDGEPFTVTAAGLRKAAALAANLAAPT